MWNNIYTWNCYHELSINLRCYIFFIKILFIYFQREGKGSRKRGKHQCVVAFHAPPTGDLACNPGMCPDWESNCDPLVHRPALNPLSYTSQGRCYIFNFCFCWLLGNLQPSIGFLRIIFIFLLPLCPSKTERYQNVYQHFIFTLRSIF